MSTIGPHALASAIVQHLARRQNAAFVVEVRAPGAAARRTVPAQLSSAVIHDAQVACGAAEIALAYGTEVRVLALDAVTLACVAELGGARLALAPNAPFFCWAAVAGGAS